MTTLTVPEKDQKALSDDLHSDSESCELPADVERFCMRNRLFGYLSTAKRLVRKYFELDDGQVQLQTDPETGEQWIALRATARGTIEVILQNEDKYTEEFGAEVPWPAAGKIRLVYDVS